MKNKFSILIVEIINTIWKKIKRKKGIKHREKMTDDEEIIKKIKKKLIELKGSGEDYDAYISSTSGTTVGVIRCFDDKDKLSVEETKKCNLEPESFVSTIKDNVVELDAENGKFVFILTDKGKKVKKIIKNDEK